MPTLSATETEARRLLDQQVVGADRNQAPDRATRMFNALRTLGHVAMARDPGGHEWAVILIENGTPKIIYSLGLDGE